MFEKAFQIVPLSLSKLVNHFTSKELFKIKNFKRSIQILIVLIAMLVSVSDRYKRIWINFFASVVKVQYESHWTVFNTYLLSFFKWKNVPQTSIMKKLCCLSHQLFIAYSTLKQQKQTQSPLKTDICNNTVTIYKESLNVFLLLVRYF